MQTDAWVYIGAYEEKERSHDYNGMRGGLTPLTFSNQGVITKELTITSSILCSTDCTFEFFFVASPKDIIPRL